MKKSKEGQNCKSTFLFTMPIYDVVYRMLSTRWNADNKLVITSSVDAMNLC